MKFNIEHIANLARISLTEEEKTKYEKDLSDILKYVDQLKAVDTSKVDVNLAETHPVNQLREDEAEQKNNRDAILSAAPRRKDNYFEVKAILK